jgi:hypothetical protein
LEQMLQLFLGGSVEMQTKHIQPIGREGHHVTRLKGTKGMGHIHSQKQTHICR